MRGPLACRQLGQLARGLQYHVNPLLQPLLQVGDIDLVGDAVGVADALHVALLIISSSLRSTVARGSFNTCATVLARTGEHIAVRRNR